MAPTYKAINELYSDVIDIEKIDVDDNPELAVNHQIRGVPSLVIINNDGEIARQVGAQPQQVLERWINETVQTQYVT
jgi:thioredoxin-like negative regulator of GroEL